LIPSITTKPTANNTKYLTPRTAETLKMVALPLSSEREDLRHSMVTEFIQSRLEVIEDTAIIGKECVKTKAISTTG
jgi:hypothetical protein